MRNDCLKKWGQFNIWYEGGALPAQNNLWSATVKTILNPTAVPNLRIVANLGGGNVFVLYTILVWASVLISAFIDNIPYVATMIPVIAGMATQLGVDPTPLYFGLLSGATLGGNMTPIGASANITGIGILRKEGYEVKNSDFFKIGIPFTLAAIIPAYIYIWVIYGGM